MTDLDKTIVRLGAYITALEHSFKQVQDKLAVTEKDLEEAQVKIAAIEAVEKANKPQKGKAE